MLQDSTNRLRINVTLFEFLRKDESLVIVQNDYKIINSDDEVVW